ncbi:5-formyltetrahydrofolate cyclo-ligase [Candidatus Omnitrophus magneticus]|uniref:5-formyltetrahydrofolate cyclo-ligase n=1 Tax=Candidatus Omnitrophus magneticus TaxID=1609969 RepID=A0A0F0CND6_9BACT|nr:5-formyltetrahydrofolate cyclo-ligase [Candidatus Omnitrophus magneticus]
MIDLEVVTAKKAMRKELREKLSRLCPCSRLEKSLFIQKKFIASDDFKNADIIMTYVALHSEVDTTYLIDKSLAFGKKVVVPFVDVVTHMIIPVELRTRGELVKGPYGILVPKDGAQNKVPLREIKTVIIPCLAFDKNNMRLGRGKGYYDRFLAREELSSSRTIGFAFNFQIFDSLPFDPHDRNVNLVLTD